MESISRMMEGRDMERVLRLSGGYFPPNFLSVVYERDGEILGWACCESKNGQALAHGAASEELSPFAFRRLVETFESFLRSLGLSFYVFGVHVRRARWIGLIEKIGIYERYATKGMHHWYRRRLR